tara:strand:+ start:110 stop:358 length:249 start_codon:yes stop_codon:yes gene_type:complete
MNDAIATVKNIASRKNMIGASLVLVGAVVAVGANIGFLNRVWFSLPLGIGDVTIMRIMGVAVFALGVAVLTKIDPLDLQDAV